MTRRHALALGYEALNADRIVGLVRLESGPSPREAAVLRRQVDALAVCLDTLERAARRSA